MGDEADWAVEQMIKRQLHERNELPKDKGNYFPGARPYKANTNKAETKYNNFKELVNMTGTMTKYVAVVTFLPRMGETQNTKHYDFWSSIPLQEGDIVVVDTANGLQLASMSGVKSTSNSANKWVVAKVDLNEHEERIRKEEKRKELEKAMEARAKQVDKMSRYRQMAKEDPEMAKLLAELEGVEGTLLTEGGGK